jgi:hypothetical protein
MKKIVLPIALVLFSAFFPNDTFATGARKERIMTPQYFYNMASMLSQKAEDHLYFLNNETELAFFPFEMFEAVDCDMNKSMALIELIKVAETEKQLMVAQEEAAARLLETAKEEVKEVARPKAMGMTEIMFIIEEVGRGSMY